MYIVNLARERSLQRTDASPHVGNEREECATGTRKPRKGADNGGVKKEDVHTWVATEDGQDYEVRPATPTYFGDTGLFHVSSAYTLFKGKVSFSLFRDNYADVGVPSTTSVRWQTPSLVSACAVCAGLPASLQQRKGNLAADAAGGSQHESSLLVGHWGSPLFELGCPQSGVPTR